MATAKSESDREGGKYMTLTTFLKDGDSD